jgi:HTH-like domain
MSLVGEHRDRFGVEPILRVLEVPVSTFSGWEAQQRRPCLRRRQDAWLLHKIRAVHGRSGGTDGAPRVHAQLRRDGVRTARKRVARLVGQAGLQGAFLRKRWRCSTRQDPRATPAPDLVDRNFASILKVGRAYRTSYRTREEAELDPFRYVDGWYNPHRIQRGLGWLSPEEDEEASYTGRTPGSLASSTRARQATLRGIGGTPVSPVRLASSTPLRLDHNASTGFSSGA